MKTKKAVILAAGKGQRLDKFNTLKPLVKVGGKPMILWCIKQLQGAGIENIHIVIGERGDEIKKELTGNPDVKAKIEYIEQKDSSRQGMLKSVMILSDFIAEPFFLAMSDLIIEKNPYEFFGEIDNLDNADSVYELVDMRRDRFERSAACSKIYTEGESIRFVGRDLSDYNGVEVGIYYFSPESFNLFKQIVEENLNISSFYEALQKLASRDLLKKVELKEGEWFDVNTPSTHIRAEIFARKQQEIKIVPTSRNTMRELSAFSNFYRNKVMQTDIIIETGILSRLDNVRIIPERFADSAHFILTDTVVDKLYGDKVLNGFLKAGYNVKKLVVEEGEKTKNINEYARLADEIFAHGMDKRSIIISLGGGVINNIAGFLASTLYRGIGLIHIPTTMMAQVDAAIDFKQAVNSPSGKNLLGSYYPAMCIVIDPQVLLTLDDRHINNGISESIKHALTQDVDFLQYLENNSDRIKDVDFLEFVIRKTIELKVPLLRGDVSEDYNEMLPQYGHSAGHAVEHLSSYDLLHGEALAIGMCITAEIARLLDVCGDDIVEAHYSICEKYNLPTKLPDYITEEDVCNVIKYDKHYLKGTPNMALVQRIGEVWNDNNTYSAPIDYEILKQAININKEKKNMLINNPINTNTNGENAIVTGGSRGIGKAIAKQLLEDGYNVHICARGEGELRETVQELSEFGNINYSILDLSDRDSVIGFVNNWNKDLYAIVNNAGICKTERLDEELDVWDEVLNTNLNSVYFLTKGLLKYLVDNGRIINIVSQLGKEGRGGYSAYCASKFAVNGLTKCWAKELGERGVTVNSICPGWVRTEMAEKDLVRIAKEKKISRDELYKEICAPLELKRFTEPEEVASLAAFLISPKASGITGRDM
ncbi:SDR family NAD(P)-dependent oxidoreductase, partial [Candidatus Parcubacteria bacterium]|nr:SDR family NAD(P)-dependent oxidoreductase [Candidatus Parcubacteria bacterium]